MSTQHHIIRRQRFELELGQEAGAPKVQQQLSRLLREQLGDRLEPMLSAISVRGGYLVLDKLEVNLGAVDPFTRGQELIYRLVEAIRRQIEAQLGGLVPEATLQLGKPAQLLSPEVSFLEQLLCFIQSGALPWWAAPLTEAEQLRQLRQQGLKVWRHIRPALAEQPVARRRLVQQYSEPWLLALLEKHPAYALIEQCTQVLPALLGLSGQSFKALFWKTILGFLAQPSSNTATEVVLLSRFLAAIEQEYWVPVSPDWLLQSLRKGKKRGGGYGRLETALIQLCDTGVGRQHALKNTKRTGQLPAVETTIPVWKSRLQKEHTEPFNTQEGKPNTGENNTALPHAIQLEKQEGGNTTQLGPGRQKAGREQRSTAIGPKKASGRDGQEPSELAEEKTGFSFRQQNDGESPLEPGRRLTEKAQHNGTGAPQDTPPRAEVLPSSRQAALWKQQLEEGLFINNSGLVILAPLLPKFLEQVGLVKEKAFVSMEAQERSIHLLQYLVTGETTTPEYELALNKLLCGWPLEEPIAAGIELNKGERIEAEALLQFVLSEWKVLKNTSAPRLQQLFLQRQGRLTYDEDNGYTLLVEQQAMDILLNKLPWGFGMVKLGWMGAVLVVEWEY